MRFKRRLQKTLSELLLLILLNGCASTFTQPTAIQFSPTAARSQTSTKTNTPIPPTATFTLNPTKTLTYTPTPTPVGSGTGKIAFTRIQNSSVQGETLANIYVINVDGSIPTQITTNSSTDVVLQESKWSPDGSRILYTRAQDVSEILDEELFWKAELFVMNSDGTNVQKISPVPQFTGNINLENRIRDFQGDWSPDGNVIAFSSSRHSMLGQDEFEIYLLYLDTQKVEQLTSGPGYSLHPSWSPDGSKIAFMSDRDNDWEIYIMNSDGSDVQQLTKNQFSDRYPAWSHDGSRIVFHSDRDGNIELYTISVDDFTETRITTNPATDASGQWSPDDNWIAFLSDREGDEALYIMKTDGTSIYKLYDGEDSIELFLSWSPK